MFKYATVDDVTCQLVLVQKNCWFKDQCVQQILDYMSTPQQRLETALNRLEQGVRDRQEQRQREEYEYLRQVSEQAENLKLQYEQEERAWREGLDLDTQSENARWKGAQRNQRSIWNSS